MPQKINLLEMQRMGLESGEISESEVLAFDRESVILTFHVNDGILQSEHNGKPVFPVNDDVITEGVWICKLMHLKDKHRAKGMKKLDASFFMELKQSQRQLIIDTLWENSRELILSYMQDKVNEENASRIDAAVQEAKKPLLEEIEQLKSDNAELTNELEKKRLLIESLQARPPETVVVHETEIRTVPKAVRTSPDMIHCDLFTRPTYFVHISYDRKNMFIQPHDYGKTMCLDGNLYLTGLGKLVPFTGENELRCEIVENGFRVYFD